MDLKKMQKCNSQHRSSMSNRPSLSNLAARPCFWVRVRRRKHAWHHACPLNGLKVGLGLTPRNNRLSNGKTMTRSNEIRIVTTFIFFSA